MGYFQAGFLPSTCFWLLDENESHGCDVFVTVIGCPISWVSTRVGIINPTRSKPNSWIMKAAVCIATLITNDTNSCFCMTTVGIKALYVTAKLQGSLGANQRLPGVTGQWGVAVVSISKQWVQRFSLSVNDNKVELLVNLHTKTDLGERCIPVCR